MATRRAFLGGLIAGGLAPRLGWADAGAPDFLSAAQFHDGSYRLVGLRGDGSTVFALPLPERGHAAAAHPTRALAVGFARRPGRFAVVIDCARGRETARIDAPEGRHFYGHGVFALDGDLLLTTENDYEAGEGVIGLWDATRNYARVGEFRSGGVGPHDMALMPGGQVLVVANGGIETHPDAGRVKLNLPVMRANLAYLSLEGVLLERVELDPALRMNSIRHLALADDLVGFSMQWQGGADRHPPLLGVHRRGSAPRLLQAPDGQSHEALRGYAGSIAMAEGQVAISSPRGNMVQVFDTDSGAFRAAYPLGDVCGLARQGDGFLLTSGGGAVARSDGAELRMLTHAACRWDNHIIPIPHPA